MSSVQSTSVVQKTCVVLVGSGVTSGNLLGTSLLVSTARVVPGICCPQMPSTRIPHACVS